MPFRSIMGIKAFLKKNRFIYSLNARYKAKKTRAAIARLNEEYGRLAAEKGITYNAADIPGMVRERMSKRGFTPTPKEKGAFRIFWVGANREQDYSGFIQGLERYGEVITFTNAAGTYGMEPCWSRYDQRVVDSNSKRLLAQVEQITKKRGGVDLVLGQMWAHYISPEALKQVQRMGAVTANVAMDDRLPDMWVKYKGRPMGAVGLGDGLDLTLNSSPECLVRYLIHDYPAIFWPMASDPDVFKPAEVKDIDVSFIGNKYGTRAKIVQKLEASGVKVDAYGGGWANGPVGPDKAADIFGRSKIILGVGTIAYNEDIYTLKLRDFDATMAGALYLTHRNPDLLAIFTEGEEIECYADENEAAEKAVYYLAHPERIEAIGKAAAKKARERHTWDIRIGEALEALGLLESRPPESGL